MEEEQFEVGEIFPPSPVPWLCLGMRSQGLRLGFWIYAGMGVILILFGSHAVGTAHEDSDIDLVVISSSFSGKSYWERIDILTDAIYKVFAPIEASAFTPSEWKSGKSLIVDYARNGILVK